jgi:hypothetical protein
MRIGYTNLTCSCGVEWSNANMTSFCRDICGECRQCARAMAEVLAEEKAAEVAARLDAARGVLADGGRHRDELSAAALDHRGRP